MVKRQESARIRISVSRNLRERIRQVAEVLGVPEFYVIGVCLALGVRLIEYVAVKPVVASESVQTTIFSEMEKGLAEDVKELVE